MYGSYISLGNLEDVTDIKVNYAEMDLLSGGQVIYCFTIRLEHKICTTDLQKQWMQNNAKSECACWN